MLNVVMGMDLAIIDLERPLWTTNRIQMSDITLVFVLYLLQEQCIFEFI